MEANEMKALWQVLDHRLQRDDAMLREVLRDRKLDVARHRLRPLVIGQWLQIAFGAVFVVLAVLLWRSRPESPSVIAAGVAVQVYGIVTIAFAGLMLGRLGEVDYAAPVVDIQDQLLRARSVYVRSGMVAGLPWWFLWVPVLMVLAGLGGHDLWAAAPAAVGGCLGVGAVGLLATWWAFRWARQPDRPESCRRLDDHLTGGSLRRALGQIDELRRFESE